MNADAIRKTWCDPDYPIEVKVQIEIAAQLADLNSNLSRFIFDDKGRLKVGARTITYD